MPVARPELDRLQRDFARGQQLSAIQACDALVRARPDDLPALRLLALMLILSSRFPEALAHYSRLVRLAPHDRDAAFNRAICLQQLERLDEAAQAYGHYSERFPAEWDGFVAAALCLFRLGRFDQAIDVAGRGLSINPRAIEGLIVQARSCEALGQLEQALIAFRQAQSVERTPEGLKGEAAVLLRLGQARAALPLIDEAISMVGEAISAAWLLLRADIHAQLGQVQAEIADLEQAHQLDPSSETLLKRLSTLLLRTNQGTRALALCERAIEANPRNMTARVGRDWIVSELVPIWHVPMMNEAQRNEAYLKGLADQRPGPQTLVFEIGTGSGLLSMMAARLGAGAVVTCEAVGLIADTAREVVHRNGFADLVTVIGKPSQQIELGADLPRKADILVHEIFSSELLGEHVLPALEDAKARLLAPGARILPAQASVMVALVGGEEIAGNTWIESAQGFDLSPFNRIQPRRKPLYREDLSPIFLSGEIEAFRFDFEAQMTFPAQERVLSIEITGSGPCLGVIQWLRLDFPGGQRYENHPLDRRVVSGWQHFFYGFGRQVELVAGARLQVRAAHDRSRLWFDVLDSARVAAT